MILLFSSFTLVSRLGLRSALAPADLAALRFGIGGLLLLPFLARFGLSGLTIAQALILCFFGGLGFALSAYAGFLRAPANHGAVLLHGTLPFFTALLAFAVLDERAHGTRLAGLGLIFVGIGAIAWDSLRGTNLSQLTGDAFLLVASFCWSAYSVMVRRTGLSAVRAAAPVAVFALLTYVPFYLVFLESALPTAAPVDLAVQALFQGVLIGVCSILVYTRAVTALGASRTAVLAATVPCVTTLAAIPLLGEYPTTIAVAGITAASAGMVVAVRSQPSDLERRGRGRGSRRCA